MFEGWGSFNCGVVRLANDTFGQDERAIFSIEVPPLFLDFTSLGAR
jgi:hypothetical protein